VPLLLRISYSLVPKIEICTKYFLDKNSQKQSMWIVRGVIEPVGEIERFYSSTVEGSSWYTVVPDTKIVHKVFWKGLKYLKKNIFISFEKKSERLFQILVAFLEYLNFEK